MSVIRRSFGENAYLEVVVLANYGNEIFAMDSETNALVRFEAGTDRFGHLTFNPFAIWKIRLSSEPVPTDPSRPELIEPAAIEPIGQWHNKRAISVLGKECSSPTSIPILGFNGPSISYSQITGKSPSVTIIELNKRQAIRKNSYGEVTISFPWGQIIASLPIGNENERQLFEDADRPLNSDKEIRGVLGFRPKYVVAGLARPRAGYCRKMALGLLPAKISRKIARNLRGNQLRSTSMPSAPESGTQPRIIDATDESSD